jgi:hypothetical protein
MSTQATLVGQNLPSLLAEAKLRDTEYDDSPAAIRRCREVDVERNFILNFYAATAEGSKVTFLYFRQHFAAQLAAQIVLRFVFGSGLAPIPTLCLFGDFLRIAVPGYFGAKVGLPQLPLTEAVLRFVPKFVLTGSFATSWNTVPDVLWKHRKKFRIILGALLPDEVRAEDAEGVIAVCGKLASQAKEEADKAGRPFPFALLDHLIENAANSVLATLDIYAWM